MEDFATRLLNWFDEKGRKNLPWRHPLSPYRVWVSEIMLQQTQVATVIPYFERFVSRFPTIDMLASASEDEVLHQWTGLGYYARARNLHNAAREIMAEYNGDIPLSVSQLQALPGIGRSTAGAIYATCTDRRAAILDGNVKRVLARCFTISGWPGQAATLKALWEKAEQLTPETRVADYTQAIMDLGAMVCTRRNPCCDACPFAAECVAHGTGAIEQYPGKKPRSPMPVKKTTMLMIESAGEILLEKRPSAGLWGGLYSFPECDENDLPAFLATQGLRLGSSEALAPFRHTFTHFHLDILPIRVAVSERTLLGEPGRYCWYSPAAPAQIGLTRPVSILLERLHSEPPIL